MGACYGITYPSFVLDIFISKWVVREPLCVMEHAKNIPLMGVPFAHALSLTV